MSAAQTPHLRPQLGFLVADPFFARFFLPALNLKIALKGIESGIFCCLDLVIFSDTRGQHPGHPPPVTVPISRQKLLDRTCCLNSGMVTDRGEKNRSWFPPDEFSIFFPETLTHHENEFTEFTDVFPDRFEIFSDFFRFFP